MSSHLIYITWCQIEEIWQNSIIRTKTTSTIEHNIEDNIDINWRTWLHAYQLYATAAGVITKSEKVHCAVFLHVAGSDAQKVAQTLNLDSTDRDKITPLIKAFKNYCEGKDNITVVWYKLNFYNQVNESMEN